jgi:hypothetical protein
MLARRATQVKPAGQKAAGTGLPNTARGTARTVNPNQNP